MTARSLALGTAVLVAAALLWVLIVGGDSLPGSGTGPRAVVTPPPGKVIAEEPIRVPVADASHLVTAAPPVDEQVEELVADLDALHATGRADREALGFKRVNDFVLTAAGAEQQAEAVRALELRFDASDSLDPEHAWTSARLLVALGGLGAGDAAFARLEQVPESERADVLMGLVWDPLREGEGLAFEVAELDTLIPHAPLLPVTTGRLAPAAAQPLLDHLARELPAGVESPRLRNAAIVALGVGIDVLPAVAPAYAAFLDHELPTPQSALRPALFVLLSARGAAARGLLTVLQRRHAPWGASEEWDFGGRPYLDELVQVEAVARREQIAKVAPLLAAVEDGTLSADDRLHAAFSLHTWASLHAQAQLPRDARRSIGDRINACIDRERDVDVASMLSRAVFWTGSSYAPDPDDPFLKSLMR